MAFDDSMVKQIMDKYGIPYYVWWPIMQAESGGNPQARAVTDREDSRGLFQINLPVHPQYTGLDLFDPAVNAEIAARDFLAPAYAQAKQKYPDDPVAQTLYVHKYGIKPQWTAALAEKDAALARQALSASLPGQSIGPAPEVKSLWDRFKEFWAQGYKAKSPEDWQKQQELLLPGAVKKWATSTAPGPGGLVDRAITGMLTGVAYFLIVIVALFAAYLVFRPEPGAIVKEIIKGGKK